MRQTINRLVAAAVIAAVAGCGDSNVEPEDVVGQYVATTFTIVINGVSTDMLARGASIDVELKSDGTTAGRVVIPVVAGIQTTAVDDDLAGTYAITTTTVRFDQTDPGSYLDNLIFTVDPPELRAFIVLSDPTRTGNFSLILTRQ